MQTLFMKHNLLCLKKKKLYRSLDTCIFFSFKEKKKKTCEDCFQCIFLRIFFKNHLLTQVSKNFRLVAHTLHCIANCQVQHYWQKPTL